jgi:general stress protein YciG
MSNSSFASDKNPHAVALGRKGGKANKGRTSDAKAAAARENGKKGGRPKKVTI